MRVIHVTPLDELANVISSTGAKRWVSFAAPGKSEPAPEQFKGERLALEFHDISEPQAGLQAPSRDDAKRLITFFMASNDDLILQCWMGVSRSTAGALIALLLSDPERDCAKAAARLRQAAPFATPNPLLIAHADDVLGLDGHLIKATRSIGRGTTTDRGRPFTLVSEHA